MNERLKELRLQLNLSQQEFADKVSVSRNFVSLVEMGERNYSARAIRDICKVFSINEEWLRYGTGEMYSRDKDEVAEIVSKFMDNEDDEFNQLLLQAMRLYQNLDSKNQEIIRDFINKLRK